MEQVTGRTPRQQFQVQMQSSRLEPFMDSLCRTFGAADLHYWIMPVFEGGSVSAEPAG